MQDLTVSKRIIQEMIVSKFITDKEIVGFYILNQPKEQIIELEFLLVLPSFIGKGIGSKLIQHAFEKAKQLNCKQVNLATHLKAVSFYESKGFISIDKKESTIAGGFLAFDAKRFNNTENNNKIEGAS